MTVENISNNHANIIRKEELVEFSLQQIQSLNDNITFADTKIGIVSTISLAIIAVLTQYLQNIKITTFQILLLLSLFSFCFSVIFGLITIFPRYITTNKNIFFWKSITEFESAEQYLVMIKNMPYDDFLLHSSCQIRSLSTILSKKYKNIKTSLVFFLFGLGLSIVYVGIYIISTYGGK